MGLAYLDKMIADGYGRGVTVGAFSTPVGGGTILDLDQPHLAVAIPEGHVIRPIYLSSSLFAGISTADADETELLVSLDSLALWTGDGTSTAENVSNLNSKKDKGSACRVGSAFTGNMTTTPRNGGAAAAPVLDLELYHFAEVADQAGTAANVAYRMRNPLYQPDYPIWAEGPATFFVHIGGTVAVTGLTVVQWVEAPPDIMRKYMKGEL